MRKAWFFAVPFTLLLGATSEASIFTLDSVVVNSRSVDPGLMLTWSPLPSADWTFELNEGDDPFTTALFQIGTPENALNFDDIVPYPISATLSFSTPYMAGQAFGFSGAAWWRQSFGYVLWDNPLPIAFGTNGLLEVTLSHAAFGLPGSDTVYATFDLRRDDVPAPASVPEPGTFGLLAIGLTVAACRGGLRRGFRTS